MTDPDPEPHRTWTPAQVIDLFTEAGILVELGDRQGEPTPGPTTNEETP